MAGLIAPMAGHKGYAIAVMMDLLSVAACMPLAAGAAEGIVLPAATRADLKALANELGVPALD